MMRAWIPLMLFTVFAGCVSGPRVGEILPAGEMQKEYGLHCEKRPNIRLKAELVPTDLRDLIPLAEKWGIGDDVIRYDCEQRASEAEKAHFKHKLTGRTKRINEWLDKFPGDKPTDESSAFMYITLALDEMGLWPDR